MNKEFDSSSPELLKLITRARSLSNQYNQLAADYKDKRHEILTELLGSVTDDSYIDIPFYCDYGKNIHIGKNVYIGLNCTFIDNDKITIGDNTLIASSVNISTGFHPITAKERIFQNEDRSNNYKTFKKPVAIGKNCWIGANVTIIPGVSIGDNTTIGAGSVVVKDIPNNCVAVGNPCKVIRSLD